MEDNGEGLDQRALLGGHLLGEEMAEIGWVGDDGLQSAVGVGKGLCAGFEGQVRTEIVAATGAERTYSAWDADFEGDTVAFFEGDR